MLQQAHMGEEFTGNGKMKKAEHVQQLGLS
jgi:hypothetical protein